MKKGICIFALNVLICLCSRTIWKASRTCAFTYKIKCFKYILHFTLLFILDLTLVCHLLKKKRLTCFWNMTKFLQMMQVCIITLLCIISYKSCQKGVKFFLYFKSWFFSVMSKKFCCYLANGKRIGAYLLICSGMDFCPTCSNQHKMFYRNKLISLQSITNMKK